MTPESPQPRRWSWAYALPAGAAGAVLGLLPWIVAGGRLPEQELWTATTTAMPFVLLPFSFTSVVLVFSLLIVGATVAGIAGRMLRVRGWGLLLLVLGVLIVQGLATAQTATVLRAGLQERLESTVYLAALVAGTVLSMLVGAIVTILVAGAPRAGALIGLTIGAIGMGSWTALLWDPGRTAESVFSALLPLTPWIAPVLTGIAIAWTGIGTAGRVIAALAALVMVWVAPAVTTALFNALGSRVLLRSSSDLIDYGVGVFQAALLTPELALRPVLAAAGVAALGLGLRALGGRRRRGAASADPPSGQAPADPPGEQGVQQRDAGHDDQDGAEHRIVGTHSQAPDEQRGEQHR